MAQQLQLKLRSCWCQLEQFLEREQLGAEGGREVRSCEEGGLGPGRGGMGSGEEDPGTLRTGRRTSLLEAPLSPSFLQNRSRKLCSKNVNRKISVHFQTFNHEVLPGKLPRAESNHCKTSFLLADFLSAP